MTLPLNTEHPAYCFHLEVLASLTSAIAMPMEALRNDFGLLSNRPLKLAVRRINKLGIPCGIHNLGGGRGIRLERPLRRDQAAMVEDYLTLVNGH